MELFLAKLFGLYFVIIGAIIVLRRKSVIPAVGDLAGSRGLLLMVASIEIAAGLGLVVAYPTASWSLTGVLSLIGYMLLIEGIIYLALPTRTVRKFIRSFNQPSWYLSGGLLAIIVGFYLAGTGFGWF